MNTKIILSIAAIALVAAALVGVTAAEFASNQTTNSTANSQALPPCATNDGTAPYCVNATNGEPYCNYNGTCTGYCQDTQACNGYDACEQNRYQEQYRYGCGGGMMGRSGYGIGCRR